METNSNILNRLDQLSQRPLQDVAQAIDVYLNLGKQQFGEIRIPDYVEVNLRDDIPMLTGKVIFKLNARAVRYKKQYLEFVQNVISSIINTTGLTFLGNVFLTPNLDTNDDINITFEFTPFDAIVKQSRATRFDDAPTFFDRFPEEMNALIQETLPISVLSYIYQHTSIPFDISIYHLVKRNYDIEPNLKEASVLFPGMNINWLDVLSYLDETPPPIPFVTGFNDQLKLYPVNDLLSYDNADRYPNMEDASTLFSDVYWSQTISAAHFINALSHGNLSMAALLFSDPSMSSLRENSTLIVQAGSRPSNFLKELMEMLEALPSDTTYPSIFSFAFSLFPDLGSLISREYIISDFENLREKNCQDGLRYECAIYDELILKLTEEKMKMKRR